MSNKERIEYWANEAQKELNCFKDDTVYKYMKALDDAGILFYKELDENKGIVAYTITQDFCGNKCVQELFMYIKPEHRGNPRNVIKMVHIMEEEATKNDCDCVLIGSNIGYRDDKLLALLEKKGYTKDTVRKFLKERT
jgi:hypothetical protein